MVFLLLFVLSGCNYPKDKHIANPLGCVMLVNISSTHKNEGTILVSESGNSTNGIFSAAEDLGIPDYYTDTPVITRLNGYILSAADVDIYKYQLQKNGMKIKLTLLKGTSVCKVYQSSVISGSSTSVPDSPPLSYKGTLVPAPELEISLTPDFPFLYITCEDTQAGEYALSISSAVPMTDAHKLWQGFCFSGY